MTTEHKLIYALTAYLKERNQELATGPLDDLVIPLKTGDSLTVPMILLSNAGEQG